MPDNRIIKPFESFTLTMIFIFSTIWGLYYYYSLGTTEKLKMDGLDENTNEVSSLGLIGIISGIMDFISWLSPFALVKSIVLIIAPPPLYDFVNIFVLRPVGWVGAIFTANYIISKIPTISSE